MCSAKKVTARELGDRAAVNISSDDGKTVKGRGHRSAVPVLEDWIDIAWRTGAAGRVRSLDHSLWLNPAEIKSGAVPGLAM